MKEYPEYKDSGVEWVGDIPSHWHCQKLKYVTQINPSKGCSDYSAESEELATFLPMEAVGVDGSVDISTQRPISELWNGFTYFERDDVILAKITPCFENGKGAHLDELGSRIGFGSTEFHVLRYFQNMSVARFLYYLTKSSRFCNMGQALMVGAAGQKRVPTSFLEDYCQETPPIDEQQAIADFLDDKTEKIDKLIDTKRKQIELLKEQRTAVINQAVTKGLDPNVEMKDSGIEWLGEIPKHWQVVCLRRVSEIRYGLGQPPAELEGGLPLMRATNISKGKITTEDMLYVDPQDIPYDRNPILRENEIIVVRSGAYTGDSAIMPKEYEGAVTGYDMVVTVSKAEPKYIAFCLLSHYVLNNQIYLCRLRAAQPHLNAEELGSVTLMLPGNEEQRRIVEHINRESESIDVAISKAHRQIELLSEYRTTLISEAVTGKIDVRGEVYNQ